MIPIFLGNWNLVWTNCSNLSNIIIWQWNEGVLFFFIHVTTATTMCLQLLLLVITIHLKVVFITAKVLESRCRSLFFIVFIHLCFYLKVLLELAYWFENRTASQHLPSKHLLCIEKYFLSTAAFNSQIFAISNFAIFCNILNFSWTGNRSDEHITLAILAFLNLYSLALIYCFTVYKFDHYLKVLAPNCLLLNVPKQKNNNHGRVAKFLQGS